MESKARKKIVSCRLIPSQESGRIRWCVGHEKTWQSCLKRLAILPIILLPIVVVIILVTRYNFGFNEVPTINLEKSNRKNESFLQEIETRQKRQILREERFSYLFKRCYKLYVTFHSEKESFPDATNNREPKLDYIDEYPGYFVRNPATFPGENQGKHRQLRKCLEKFRPRGKSVDIFQQNNYRKRYKKNSTNDGKTSHTNSQIAESKNDVSNFRNKKKTPNEVKYQQSKIMQRYMNPEINPCDDFYEYACGNWKNYYEIPPGRTSYDTYDVLKENKDLVMRKLLESDYNQKPVSIDEKNNYHDLKNFLNDNYVIFDSSDAIDKAKTFYRSCMKKGTINRRTEKPLVKLLEDLGHWPLITPSWKEREFNFIWLLSRLNLLNTNILINQWTDFDDIVSNESTIYIDQPTMKLPGRDYFLHPRNITFIKGYKSYILSIANLLGTQISSTVKDIDDMVEFETKLAEITSFKTTILRSSVGKLSIDFPSFPWKDYLIAVLGKESISFNSIVKCYCIRYISQLLLLLNKTNPRVIQNYMLWRFINERVVNLDYRFIDAFQKFNHQMFGVEKKSRWRFCVLYTEKLMGMASGALFVKHYFDRISKFDTIKITERLIEAYMNMFKEQTWLNPRVRDVARANISNMNLKVGFPNFLLNSTDLNAKYNNVEIKEKFFLENVLNLLRHSTLKHERSLNKTDWDVFSTEVKAYSKKENNQILLPAGILQPPLYHKFFPKALNFAGIGVIMGRIAIPRFNSTYWLSNKKKNLQLSWKNSTIKKNYQHSQCKNDLYNTYVLSRLNSSLDNIQEQVMSDKLKQTFKAYQKWVSENPDADETLPRVNMTGTQLFFLNFAQVSCGKQKLEHFPGMFRVIGTLRNSKEFARVYNCPINSPMNPKNKCVLW